MAYTKLETRKDGSRYYTIRVSRGYGLSGYSMRWDVPDGLSEKYIKRELHKVARDFEKRCEAGEVMTRAEKHEQERLEALEQSKINTVKQYGDNIFLPTKEIELSVNTCDYYEDMLQGHVYPEIGSRKLPDVTSADIQKIILSMQKEGYSYSTIRGVYITVNQLFKMAYKSDLIDRNPCDKVDHPKRKKGDIDNKDKKAFSKNELQYIIQCLDNEPLKWRALIRLLIDTGIRRGEALGLKWSAVDLKNKRIRIENNLCYSENKGLYETSPKSNKARTISISDEVAELLKEQKREQLSQTLISKYVFNQDASKRPVNPRSVGRYLERFGKKYDIEDCHAHKFRHTFATLAITNGADIASVSEILGHSEKSITLDMYTHADEEAQERAAEIFRKSIYQENISQ